MKEFIYFFRNFFVAYHFYGYVMVSNKIFGLVDGRKATCSEHLRDFIVLKESFVNYFVNIDVCRLLPLFARYIQS